MENRRRARPGEIHPRLHGHVVDHAGTASMGAERLWEEGHPLGTGCPTGKGRYDCEKEVGFLAKHSAEDVRPNPLRVARLTAYLLNHLLGHVKGLGGRKSTWGKRQALVQVVCRLDMFGQSHPTGGA